MKKSDELSIPTSCLNIAKPDERIFVILGRDVAAPDTIRFWAAERVRCGKNKDGDEQIVEALTLADAIELEQRAKASSR